MDSKTQNVLIVAATSLAAIGSAIIGLVKVANK